MNDNTLFHDVWFLGLVQMREEEVVADLSCLHITLRDSGTLSGITEMEWPCIDSSTLN